MGATSCTIEAIIPLEYDGEIEEFKYVPNTNNLVAVSSFGRIFKLYYSTPTEAHYIIRHNGAPAVAIRYVREDGTVYFRTKIKSRIVATAFCPDFNSYYYVESVNDNHPFIDHYKNLRFFKKDEYEQKRINGIKEKKITIISIDANTNQTRKHKSIEEASRDLNMSISNVKQALYSRINRRACHYYIFEEADYKDFLNNVRRRKIFKFIIQNNYVLTRENIQTLRKISNQKNVSMEEAFYYWFKKNYNEKRINQLNLLKILLREDLQASNYHIGLMKKFLEGGNPKRKLNSRHKEIFRKMCEREKVDFNSASILANMGFHLLFSINFVQLFGQAKRKYYFDGISMKAYCHRNGLDYRKCKYYMHQKNKLIKYIKEQSPNFDIIKIKESERKCITQRQILEVFKNIMKPPINILSYAKVNK